MSLAVPNPSHRPKFYTVNITASDAAVKWGIPEDAVGLRINVRSGGGGNVYMSSDGEAGVKLDTSTSFNISASALRIPTEINNVVPRADALYFDCDGSGHPAVVEIIAY